eukprot:TRINITY_DN1891_c0_g1_i1.p1 TRINITY_DN1891_c0_g1~~TRINITY_DN1891_c0_g1_i1.p1  ORF type:complete len:1047 (+),score=480.83 TRINITY_DN1891_c0_g1_i1:115-3255(+)
MLTRAAVRSSAARLASRAAVKNQVRGARSEPAKLKELRSTIAERQKQKSKALVALGNEWFGVAHTNHEKTLEFDGFVQVLKRMGFEVTSEEADELFQHFDRDNSGEISYDEFIMGIRGDLPQFSSSMKLPGAHVTSAMKHIKQKLPAFDLTETEEWAESLHATVEQHGKLRARILLHELLKEAQHLELGIRQPVTSPFCNTIPAAYELPYPGDLGMERKLSNIVRWNAAVMVSDGNERAPGLGGHIGTYASIADVYMVLQNHILRGKGSTGGMGDQLYVQGHSSPGPYALAFLEGRLSLDHLLKFRREVLPGTGLSSYPHPRLMPDFWENPSVSLGIGGSQAVHQARLFRYMHLRGLCDTSRSRVWCILGDGEMDESESISAVAVAGRERLNNLIFIVNCNYQRLDGPVRGNAKVIQEFEGMFRGAGFEVIKCIWGGEWNKLVENDPDGTLIDALENTCDGDCQRLHAKMDGAAVRKEIFKGPLADRVAHLSDAELLDAFMTPGGHDHVKIYNALRQAEKNAEEGGRPTAILFKTLKGHSLKTFVGRNPVHGMKQMKMEELEQFHESLGIPLSKEQLEKPDAKRFCDPGADSPEVKYFQARRAALGGPIPQRVAPKISSIVKVPESKVYEKFYGGVTKNPASTTMGYGQILSALMAVPEFGRRVVPITTDEYRTFGMEGMFARFKIHAPFGQRYKPVDADQLMSYKEAPDGQMIQEGISEAGAMSTWLAAGTAYTSQGCPMLPFFIYYSMFGFQRVGDFIWQGADARARGFLMGATAGRTTLNGEGLQHQDGHSLLICVTNPACRGWDPAFIYELAVVMERGIQEMWDEDKDVIYYVMVNNENALHPAMPQGVKGDIVKGLYKFRDANGGKQKVRLLGSGAIMFQVLAAADMLEKDYGVGCEIWSVPSYGELHREILSCERSARLNPGKPAPQSWAEQCLGDGAVDVTVAASDHQKALPELIANVVSGTYTVLGTDGFGRSDTREALRRFFEVDKESIVAATLSSLARAGKIDVSVAEKAIADYGLETGVRNDICDADTWKGAVSA